MASARSLCHMMMFVSSAVAISADVSAHGVVLLQKSSVVRGKRNFATRHKESVEAASCPTDMNGLQSKYNEIFKSGNRNAASFKWFTYIASCDSVEALGKGFCPISGSPISGENSAKITLGKIGGGTQTGAFHYCCDPCICDMMDLVKVDTKTIKSKKHNVLVHGDPCKNQANMNATFTDPFTNRTDSLASSAPEVTCSHGKLQGATFSDGGFPIIGLFYTDVPSNATDGTTQQQMQACNERARQGYNSGMGAIFRVVASATPL